jgi:folate-binding protein YgfZ
VRLPDVDGIARCMLAVPAAPTSLLPPITADAWRALEVRSGIPVIEAATAEQFVPQMLNFEIVGGVDFKKGCYPGQEIVARSQYRGTIKRRMFLFECDAPLAAGEEVFHSADANQPAGMIVNAAPFEPGSTALVEVKLAALDSGTLHARAASGAMLVRRELPYDVPSDAALPV